MEEQKMARDPRKLFAAIVKAYGHDLNTGVREDILTLQRGCYILNSWGYGPLFRYDICVGGPASTEIWNYCLENEGMEPVDTDIPKDAVKRLSEIFAKGLRYVDAYVTILALIYYNPKKPESVIIGMADELEPELGKEVREAYECLRASHTSTRASP